LGSSSDWSGVGLLTKEKIRRSAILRVAVVREMAQTLLVGAVLAVLVTATIFMIAELLQRTS
jgi:hypothetical protein